MSRDMEIFVPSARTKDAEYSTVISGSGWAWVSMRGGENSLSYVRGREQGRVGEWFYFLVVYMVQRWLYWRKIQM